MIPAPPLHPLPTLPVADIYGPVLQGEGRWLGLPVAFLRLGLCNLDCAWCDTPYTWDRSTFDVDAECPPLTADEIVDRLPEAEVVVLSGGEPLMHRSSPALKAVLDSIAADVHVETNGTLIPPQWMVERVAWWSVSPKLPHSGVRSSKAVKPKALAAFADLARQGRAGFKVVARTPDDVPLVAGMADTYDLPRYTVTVMAEGVTPVEQLHTMRLLEPAVVAHGLTMTPRLHSLLHGEARCI